ncbi:small ubiquitin-related modifier domain-containing protein [Argonema antarcticum]|uniref:small ubiquitin-related modifier domain-containing protein n=1 Tax=Argonema antarcticum TaxID=2942763 RepID=UPI002013B289|nr:small ubiquitin-related modifier domain-containing protein [Argonema antarcticum]MCL1471004.1 hypothetical protein [Argonema antarcticum A004/B2]
MANSLSVIVRMADGTRKAAINIPPTLTVGQILQTTQEKWNLPSNFNYGVRLERTGQQLNPSATLGSQEVEENDVLEVYPNLEAG